MKKVLITNFSVVQFSGSEINCSTIAKRLKELGYEVYMAAFEFASPLYDVVKDNFDYSINLLENDFDFSQIEFDLVWAHHSYLLDWLIFEKGLRVKKIITSSLSPVEPFEAAPIYANDLCLTLANSKETETQLKEVEGIEKVHLFENYSFKSYFDKNIEINKLNKIAVVSNHIPQEEIDAIDIIRGKGYIVDIYGNIGTKILVTDEVLEKYDCIVTIGKTVQYAMSLKIPVYIYDIHGGDGYLTLDNIETNRAHNFSGRGFTRKTGEEIANEIMQNFEGVLHELEEIKTYCLNNFCFENKVDEVLNLIEQCNDVNLDEIRKNYEKCKRNLLVSKRLTEHMLRRNDEILKQQTIDFYQLKDKELAEKQREIDNRGYLMNEKDGQIQKLSEENKALKDELEQIKKSKVWKVVRFLKK